MAEPNQVGDGVALRRGAQVDFGVGGRAGRSQRAQC